MRSTKVKGISIFIKDIYYGVNVIFHQVHVTIFIFKNTLEFLTTFPILKNKLVSTSQ